MKDITVTKDQNYTLNYEKSEKQELHLEFGKHFSHSQTFKSNCFFWFVKVTIMRSKRKSSESLNLKYSEIIHATCFPCEVDPLVRARIEIFCTS